MHINKLNLPSSVCCPPSTACFTIRSTSSSIYKCCELFWSCPENCVQCHGVGSAICKISFLKSTCSDFKMTREMHFIFCTMYILHKSTWARVLPWSRALEEQSRATKKHQTIVRNRSRVCFRIESDLA